MECSGVEETSRRLQTAQKSQKGRIELHTKNGKEKGVQRRRGVKLRKQRKTIQQRHTSGDFS